MLQFLQVGGLLAFKLMEKMLPALFWTRMAYPAHNTDSLPCFDITRFFLQPKVPRNVEVSLGMCKYGYQIHFCKGAHAATDVCKAFLMSMRLTYRNGDIRTVVTSAHDKLWKATTEANPIRYSHLYHGEQYDGRVITEDPAKWQACVPAMFDTGAGRVPPKRALGTPVLFQMPALKVTTRYAPVSVHSPKVGAWVFDFGDNMAGFAKLSLQKMHLLRAPELF